MSVEESFVLIDSDSAVATLTLNRPAQFNVLSTRMINALQTALDQVRIQDMLSVDACRGIDAFIEKQPMPEWTHP